MRFSVAYDAPTDKAFMKLAAALFPATSPPPPAMLRSFGQTAIPVLS
jgi:hypothetical protein